MNKTIEGIIFDWNNYWIPRIDVILLSLGLGLSVRFSSLDPITMFGMIAAAFNMIASSSMWGYGFWYKHGFEETKL